MAKRRRLTDPSRPPASADPVGQPARDPGAVAGAEAEPVAVSGGGLETKAHFPSFPLGLEPRVNRPPIAAVAGQAAERAALDEVARALTEAREEGRLVQRLPLAAIEAGHLLRDRLHLDEGEMAALETSLRERGQQAPIEVVALGASGAGADDERFGLVSGWRRLEALRRIGAETALAFVRRPESSAEAYRAMVEENEIRAGLSFYERARIAAEAARLGLFRTSDAAIAQLFASASAPKRSKIGAFVLVHETLGQHLRFPAAIPEKLGLALAAALADGAFAPRLRDTLRRAEPATPEAERAVLERALRKRPAGAGPARGEEVAPGLFLKAAKGGALSLSGPGVTPALRRDLRAWLARR